MKEKIQTASAPQAIGPYSQAIKINNHVYFSGQIPLDFKTMKLVSEHFRQQAVQVFKNLEQVALASGGQLDSIVKLMIYLTDLVNFDVLNEVMMEFFNQPYPARTTIQVSALPKGAKIEVDAVMVI